MKLHIIGFVQQIETSPASYGGFEAELKIKLVDDTLQ
jgi:hypothetical protein